MSSLYTPVNKVRSNMHLAIDKCVGYPRIWSRSWDGFDVVNV